MTLISRHSDSVDAALAKLHAAEQNLIRSLQHTFPRGTTVVWQAAGRGRASHTQTGIVIGVTGDKVQVRNARTGAELCLPAYRLSSAYGGGALSNSPLISEHLQ